ncbi:hypothetical protein [Gemmobacter denitrificans]|uniref:Uncharacterized protein n=1 Tax=Gemmobacter denitrificans TaxID=3123040 RepID=A0ABU8BRK3_9RHOB
MLEHLPQEIRDGLDLAQGRRARRSRLRVQLGEAVFPVLSLTEDQIVLEAAKAPRLRGIIDVFDGANHILQGLVIASEVSQGRLVCSFKRSNVVSDRPALDYVRDPDAPSGLLPRN